jgi:type IV pilus assembly protein PilM
MNPDAIKNTIKDLLRSKGDSVLGIDIGSSAIKVVQLAKKGDKAYLETYGELALGPYAGKEIGQSTNLPAEKVAEALVDILREAKTTTKNCGISIPLSASLLTLMEMPALGEDKLKEMIPLEVRKYIPVPISEVLLDWWIIPKQESNYAERKDENIKSNTVDVLAVAIHNEVIKKFQKVVSLAGLRSGFFEIEIFSTIRSVLERTKKPVMIVDIGAANSKVYIVEKGLIRNSHTIPLGSQRITLSLSTALGIDINQAEEVKRIEGIPEDKSKLPDSSLATIENIFYESKRVLINYQNKYNVPVSKAILTGGGAVMANLREIAESIFEIDVELGDPFSRVEAPAFLNEVLKTAGPEFSVAIGLALRKLDELQ